MFTLCIFPNFKGTKLQAAKALIVCLCLNGLIFLSCFAGAAQKVTIDSKGNYIAVKSSQDSSKATNTGKTYTDSKGIVYPVYISANGKLFIIRTSKTGNVYKQYLKIN